jgi:hypothetical protein
MPFHSKAKHQLIVTKKGEMLSSNKQPYNIGENSHNMQYKTRDMYGQN